MEMQLVKTNGQNAPAAFGGRGEIAALKDRIVAMLPGAAKMTSEELWGLAQLSVAHGLNPFNGEVWAIPGKGLMIGVKGLRKAAHAQISRTGGNFWVDYREIVDENERKRWRIAIGDLAFEARLYDSDNVRTFTETIKALLGAGIPWDAVENMVGTRPYTSGIGVLRANEQTKMEPVQCARKRAEANAIKQRFDIPFGVSVEDTEDERDNSSPSYSDPAFVAGQIEADKIKHDQAALFGEESGH